MAEIRFTDYFRDRLKLRCVPEETIRRILTESAERYVDRETGRSVAVGRATYGRKGGRLLMVAYERGAID